MLYYKDVIELVKLFGSIAGIIAFSWKILEEYNSFVKVRVESSKDLSNPSILTEIENTNRLKHKKILNAFLIISKINEPLLEVGKTIAKELNVRQSIHSLDDFKFLKSDSEKCIESKILFIPLEFYYIENTVIGDEKLSYRYPIKKEALSKGIYEVRFYIGGKGKYSRNTQDLLIIT